MSSMGISGAGMSNTGMSSTGSSSTRQMWFRRAGSIVAVALLTASISACGGSRNTLLGPEWVVTDVYLTPEQPGAFPSTESGAATMSFGQTTAAISTGCVPIQAQIEYLDASEDVPADQATELVIANIDYPGYDVVEQGTRGTSADDASRGTNNPNDGNTDLADCAHRSLHDALSSLIVLGARFRISWRGEGEVVLTKEAAPKSGTEAESVDAPSIRLATSTK